MERKELEQQLNKTTEEVDEIVDEIKSALHDEQQLITPTNFRDKVGLHHHRYSMVTTFLINNDEDVIEIPSSTKGRLLAHKDRLQDIVDKAMD